MAIRDTNTLKAWFLRGMKPVAEQFADWIDSFWHKNESIPMTSITDLATTLNTKAEKNLIDAETAARIAADESLQIQIDAIDTSPGGEAPEYLSELKYGTCEITSAPFVFARFAATNEDSEQFDVLEVSFSPSSEDDYYTVSITDPPEEDGICIMIFNVPTEKYLNMSFEFPCRVMVGIDQTDLSFDEGVYALTLLKASQSNLINIGYYGV